MRGYGIFLLVLLLLQGVLAADLTGTIYDANLDEAKNVLVSINTTPQQRMLTNGMYAFTVPPGEYTITASYQDGTSSHTSVEQITVAQDGQFTFDLFLFPELDSPAIEAIDDELLEDEQLAEDIVPAKPADILARLLIVVAVFVFIFVVWKYAQRQTSEDVDDFSKRVLDFIDAEGGRITQKELRKHFPHSEAKMSLVVTELEANGKIQKIKKGRSNILVRK